MRNVLKGKNVGFAFSQIHSCKNYFLSCCLFFVCACLLLCVLVCICVFLHLLRGCCCCPVARRLTGNSLSVFPPWIQSFPSFLVSIAVVLIWSNLPLGCAHYFLPSLPPLPCDPCLEETFPLFPPVLRILSFVNCLSFIWSCSRYCLKTVPLQVHSF